MRVLIAITIAALLPALCVAQENLVSNGGFEDGFARQFLGPYAHPPAAADGRTIRTGRDHPYRASPVPVAGADV